IGVLGVSTTPPTGGSTVIADAAVPMLPLASRERKTTFVVPSGNSVLAVASITVAFTLACGTRRTGAASRRSTAVPPARNAPTRCDTAEAGTLPRAPLISVAATVMAAGGVTDGANVSTTITLNDAVRVFPCVSLAVHATVVAPSGNVDPQPGVHATATLPSTASTAEAVYVNTAPVAPVASTLAFGGTVMTGGVVSGAFPTVT